ncbi:MAG: aromatic amino acid transport family protein [Patescibacteria group bacterium]
MLNKQNKGFLRAILTVTGTIIGAGVFALPVAFKTTGILTGSVVYWFIALLILLMHLQYADIILSDESMKNRRLPGHAGKVLGAWAKKLVYFTHALQIIGASLAYLILGGEFLAVITRHYGLNFDIFWWQILFWLGGSLVIFFGLKLVARVESAMTWALVASLLISCVFYASKADGSLFWSGDWSESFMPLGIFLFALFGLQIMPEITELCSRNKYKTKVAITIGTLTAAFVMWLFGIFAFSAIRENMITYLDLPLGLPGSIFWLIPIVGFLAVATSFLTLNLDLKSMFHLDIGLSNAMSYVLALGAPLVLLILLTRDFLKIVDLSGNILNSVNGFLVSLMTLKLLYRKKNQKIASARLLVPCLTAAAFLSVFIWRIIIIFK